MLDPWLLAFDSLKIFPVVTCRTNCFPPEKGQIGGCNRLRPEGGGGNWLLPNHHCLGFSRYQGESKTK